MSKSKKSAPSAKKVFSSNRKAFYDYEVLKTLEGGLVLKGGEVKSIKTGTASIKESFIHIDKGEVWLWNAHVPKWPHSGDTGYDPTRGRKVLLGRREIEGLVGKVKEKGISLIPLKLYGVKGKVKVEIGVCRGKKKYEKRQKEKERHLKKELHKEKRKYMV
jgi:SsrA-binding protein